MADLTWFFKKLLRRISELMEHGVAGRRHKAVGERKTLFIKGAGTFGHTYGRARGHRERDQSRNG